MTPCDSRFKPVLHAVVLRIPDRCALWTHRHQLTKAFLATRGLTQDGLAARMIASKFTNRRGCVQTP